MKKRSSVVSLLLAVAIVFSSISPIFAREEFKDMPTGWSKLYMESAVKNGILKGFEGKIRPTDNITRAELATILSRVLNLREKADLGNYKDVDETQWYYADLAKAVESGIIKGRSSSEIDPIGLLTREEAFTMIARVFMLATEEDGISSYKDGNKVSEWAKPSMNAMVLDCYVEGDENNRLNPQKEITREEVAAIIYRMIDIYVDENIEGKETPTNILVNGDATVIKDTIMDGDLIISEGVNVDSIILDNVLVNGRVIVRGETDIDLINGSSLYQIHSMELIKLNMDDTSEATIIGENVAVDVLDQDKDEEKPEDKDEEKPEDKDEEKPEDKDEEKPEDKDEEKPEDKDEDEIIEAPLPGKPEKGDPVTQEVVDEGERFDLATGFDKAVWVEVEEDGEVVGTGGMTEADGVAKLNLTKAGDYTVVVKDEKDGKVLKEIPLNMVEKLEVTKVTAVIDNEGKIEEGKTAQITVEAKDAEDKAVEGVEYKYESNNKDIATVDENGKVTGVAEGTATITVTTTNAKDEQTATVEVEVVKEAEEPKTPAEDSELKYDGSKELKDEVPAEDAVTATNEAEVTLVVTGSEGATIEDFDIKTAEAGVYTFTYSAEGHKDLVITVTVSEKTVEAEKLELESSELSGENLQLTFNRELTEEELGNVVKNHLRFQITRVFRVDGSPVKMDRETAKGQGLSEAKDLTLDEVIKVYKIEKSNSILENQGGWGSKFNSEKLKVTKEGKVVTIEILNDLFTHEEMTAENKINSGNAKNPDKGYKIGVHVGDKEYKIQLNTTEKEASVTGKFITVE